MEPKGGSAPDVTCSTQRVTDAKSLDPSKKVASDHLLDGTGPVPMSIDTLDPFVESLPCEVLVPSSPSSTHPWTPLYEQHCGLSRGDAVEPDTLVTDLKRPRSASFAQEERVKRDALQVPFDPNKKLRARSRLLVGFYSNFANFYSPLLHPLVVWNRLSRLGLPKHVEETRGRIYLRRRSI